MTLAIVNIPSPLRQSGDSLRWSASLITALVLHAVIGMLFIRWHAAAMPTSAPSSVTLMDLEPLPAPPQPVLQPQKVEQPPVVKQEVRPIPKPRRVERQVVTHPVSVPVPAPMPTEAAPPQTAAPTAPSVAQPNNALASFRDLLAGYLARYKRYPHAAQLKGEEGTVFVRFKLDRQGRVSEARIEQGSGHVLLDEEVLALLRRASPLPAIPDAMTTAELDIGVPVRFSLR